MKRAFALVLMAALTLIPFAVVYAAATSQDAVTFLNVNFEKLPVVTSTLHVPYRDFITAVPSSAEVKEDGRLVSNFSLVPLEEAGERSQVSMAFVLDTSSSMRGQPYAAAKESLANLLAVLPPNVRVGIFPFATSLKPVIIGTPRECLAHLEQIQVGGNTALFDAIDAGAGWLSRQPGARWLVTLTDGYDNSSHVFADEAAKQVLAHGISFIGVGYVGGSGVNVDLLWKLANSTGGSYLDARDIASLQLIFSWLKSRIMATYSFRAVLPDISPGSHTLEIALEVQGKRFLGRQTFYILAGEAARIDNTTLVASPPPSSFFGRLWYEITRPRQLDFARKLYSIPVVGGIFEFLGDTFLGIGEGGAYSFGGIAESLALVVIFLFLGGFWEAVWAARAARWTRGLRRANRFLGPVEKLYAAGKGELSSAIELLEKMPRKVKQAFPRIADWLGELRPAPEQVRGMKVLAHYIDTITELLPGTSSGKKVFTVFKHAVDVKSELTKGVSALREVKISERTVNFLKFTDRVGTWKDIIDDFKNLLPNFGKGSKRGW